MCFSLGLSCVWDSLCLLDYFLSHAGEIFNYNLFKIFSYPLFFSSSSGTLIIRRLMVCLILSQRPLRLSSVLFILFALFCSSKVISTFLSSSSLICSASDILLLIPSRVFLISVIVLFVSVCLFFNSSSAAAAKSPQ